MLEMVYFNLSRWINFGVGTTFIDNVYEVASVSIGQTDVLVLV
jgi:hypothetical protein